jgi:hypothetical protein
VLTIKLAAVPALLAGTVMLKGTGRGVRHPPREHIPQARDGAGLRLVAAWLGNGTVCCMFGLMSGVFPRLGTEIGVSATLFGALMAVAGLMRTGVFFSALRGATWPGSWRLSVAVQVAGALLMATISVAAALPWLVLVFASLGTALGMAYYVSLYASLEDEGSRGMKSGIHEAALVGGVLVGTFGGGSIAQTWGLRAPYVPIAALAVLLVVAQSVLHLAFERRLALAAAAPEGSAEPVVAERPHGGA